MSRNPELPLGHSENRGSALRWALGRLFIYIVIYVVFGALVNNLLTSALPSIGYTFPPSDVPYVNILLALGFGYLIVSAFSNAAYWSLRVGVPHSTAAAFRSMIRIIGLGALLAAIAGGVAGGTAGVALGGFLGLVVGQATQSTLGQAVSGLFLLISRPFKVGDKVTLSSEDGTVEDMSTLFTTIVKDDGKKVLLPNNSVVGTKIIIHPQQGT
jgi:small-conductance mechanosensitive channel